MFVESPLNVRHSSKYSEGNRTVPTPYLVEWLKLQEEVSLREL